MEGGGLDAARNVKIENRDLDFSAESLIFVLQEEGEARQGLSLAVFPAGSGLPVPGAKVLAPGIVAPVPGIDAPVPGAGAPKPGSGVRVPGTECCRRLNMLKSRRPDSATCRPARPEREKNGEKRRTRFARSEKRHTFAAELRPLH